MNKRKLVRDWLSRLENTYRFTIPEAAIVIGVTRKDVGNIVFKLFKNDALSRVKEDRYYTYIVNANKLKKELKKLHTRGERIIRSVAKPANWPSGIKPIPIPIIETTDKAIPSNPIFSPPRKSPRSHLVMAIDREIKELNEKIKLLTIIRKEFI